MPDQTGCGRIVFADSPWPEGHAIEELTWRARLEPGPRLWFDLELETVPYDEEHPGIERPEGGDDWTSPTVWTNYSNCRISSLDEGPGFLVGEPGRPLRLAELSTKEFRVDDDLNRPSAVDHVVDPEDEDEDEYDPANIEDYLAFKVYLLGHDSLADHRIRFPRWSGAVEFSLDWRGRIALAYVGDYAYKHAFHAVADRIKLVEIEVSDHLEPGRAAAFLAKVLVEADQFRLTETDDGLVFCYVGSS